MKRVLVFGTFDIVHPGHLAMLKEARELGSELVVSVARDSNVLRIKGREAVHSEKDRKQLVESLKIVDKVVLGAKDDYISHIVSLKPDLIALGYDQKAYTQDLKPKLEQAGLKKIKVVKLKAYKPQIYKSSKMQR